MRTRTRVRRPAPPRRGRSTRTHGRARGRYPPARRGRTSTRRRNPYRQRPGSRYNFGRSLTTAVVAGSVVVVIAVVVAGLAGGGLRAVARDLGHTGPAPDPPGSVADQGGYTARTANDAAVPNPGAVQDNL